MIVSKIRCCGDFKAVCAAVAVTIHYLFLAAFCSMLVQAVELLVKLKTVLQVRSRLATYCILGWGRSIWCCFVQFPSM